MTDVLMPRLSDTMEEGTIARWLKRPGDPVKRGDVLAEVETDKATMNLEAFEAGSLREIVVGEGATAAVGQPVARIGDAAGAVAAPAQPAPSQPVSLSDAQPAAQPGTAQAPAVASKPLTPAELPSGTGAPVEVSPRDVDETSLGNKVRATPMARRIAREHGLDLAALHGTGPQGRLIRADIDAALGAAQHPTPEQPGQTSAAVQDERVPLSAMRRTIARRMAESTQTIPHFFLSMTVDTTELVALRAQITAAATRPEDRVSLNDFVIKASALALRRVPEVNVSFDGDALIRHGHVHIGMAVATDKGLIVPVIRDADRRTLSDLAQESRRLAELARTGRLQPTDYTGGTFTVSNLGMFGVDQFNAVINPPEAAVLAVGAVVREPAEHDGQVVVREHTQLTLSVDHRALDGGIGARYLAEVRKLLEQPVLILL